MFRWADLLATSPAVMGIVNVTPDSFSDGGRHLDPAAAVDHGLALAEAGAAVLDVGGESTRPGADPVDAAEELRRVVPVVRGLVAATSVPVSVDTTKAPVARAALDAGATVVNDVAAGRIDPDILEVAARAGAGYVVMHMSGEPRTMQDAPHYDDVVAEVGTFLAGRLDAARDAGVADASLVADPGIGFGKTTAHNLALLGALGELRDRLDVPIMVGTSRKGFLGQILGIGEPSARDAATLVTVVWALERGASVVRVHDVAGAVGAVTLLQALRTGESMSAVPG